MQIDRAPLPIRLTFGMVAIIGLALYAMLFIAGMVGARDALHARGDPSVAGWTLAILHVIIFAGLSPLAISIYFWLIRSDKIAWLVGLYLFVVAVAAHWVVAVVMAHTDDGIAMAVGGIELLVCAATIVVAQRAKNARTGVANAA